MGLSRVFRKSLCYNRAIDWEVPVDLSPGQSPGFLLEIIMNVNAIYSVFNNADKSSASFTEQLLALGIGDRATARPHAMRWAAGKYGAKITQGQRGEMLPRDSAAERAMNRVLEVCFPRADKPKSHKATANKTDVVEKLLAAYAKLSAAEKRRFKAGL